MRIRKSAFCAACAVAALLAAAGLAACDTALDPIQESNLHFSVFGFLDAAADTQFIRVTPLRDSIALAPGARLDATALLEELDTGRRLPLQDSLFTYQDGASQRLAYNFWTAEPLAHGATYRLTVTRSDGAVSTATTTLPAASPPPALLLPQSIGTPVGSQTASIRITTSERIAAVFISYTFIEPDGARKTLRISYLDRLVQLAEGYGVQLIPFKDFYRQTPGCPFVEDVQVLTATAGPGWPDFLALGEETLARADVVTNVENGVGFLGGVSTWQLPWDVLTGFLRGTQNFCVQCLSFPSSFSCFGG